MVMHITHTHERCDVCRLVTLDEYESVHASTVHECVCGCVRFIRAKFAILCAHNVHSCFKCHRKCNRQLCILQFENGRRIRNGWLFIKYHKQNEWFVRLPCTGTWDTDEKCGRRKREWVRFNFIFCGLSFRVVGKMAKIQQFNWTFLLENVGERMFYECSSNQTEYESGPGPSSSALIIIIFSSVHIGLVWLGHCIETVTIRSIELLELYAATLFDNEIYNFYKLFRYFAVLFSCIFSKMDSWDATVSCRVRECSTAHCLSTNLFVDYVCLLPLPSSSLSCQHIITIAERHTRKKNGAEKEKFLVIRICFVPFLFVHCGECAHSAHTSIDFNECWITATAYNDDNDKIWYRCVEMAVGSLAAIEKQTYRRMASEWRRRRRR